MIPVRRVCAPAPRRRRDPRRISPSDALGRLDPWRIGPPLHEQNLRALRRLIGACQNRLKLDKKLRRRVNKLEEVLVRKPEKAFAALARLRSSFVVSVPGLL